MKYFYLLLIVSFALSCDKTDSHLNAEINEKPSSYIKPVSVNINCQLEEDTRFYLPLLLGNVDMNTLWDGILQGSFIGYIHNTKMDKEDDIINKIAIRTSELKQINGCLEQALAGDPPNDINIQHVSESIPDYGSTPDDDQTIETIDENPSNIDIQSKIDELHASAAAADWKKVHELSYKVSKDLASISRYKSLISSKTMQKAQQGFYAFKSKHMENKIFKCFEGRTPIPTGRIQSGYSDKLMANLINATCYPEKSSIRENLVARVTAMYLLSPSGLSFYHDQIFDSTDAQALDRIWDDFIESKDVGEKVDELKNTFSLVSKPEIGSLDQQRKVFIEHQLSYFFDETKEDYQELFAEVIALIAKQI